ncbi:glycosyl hydrolase family 3 C-terminal domain-containing protein [Lipomyces tetrasporus]
MAPVDAIKRAAPYLNSTSVVGVDMHGTLVPNSALRTLNGRSGLLRNDSVTTSVDTTINFQGSHALPANTSFVWTGQLIANTTGSYRIALQRKFPHVGGAINDASYLSVFAHNKFVLDGMEVDGYCIYGDGGAHPWSSPIPTMDLWDEAGADVYLTAGAHNLTITITKVFSDPVQVRFHWVTPEQREANIKQAVQLASQVEVPVVFAHANDPPQVNMQLIEGFDELIDRVADANSQTVVVLHNTSPVLMPWLSKVKAVLWMGDPGQEGGGAIADLLLGYYTPQGRLPVTYPASINSSMTRNPAYPDLVDAPSDTAVFSEGINTSYRWYLSTNTSVLFPFGYGLSYTTFSYTDFQISSSSASTFDVSFTLTNTGSVPGGEVPQLYIGPPSNASENYPGFSLQWLHSQVSIP